MNKNAKVVKRVSFVHVEDENGEAVFAEVKEVDKAIVVVEPPFMTAELFSMIVGKTEKAIKKDLQDGDLARFQPVARGNVYVNMAKQKQICLDAPDY
ncbi:hypothetical protein DN730_13235 [Marinomonas piezotolerans]|uniref:Uncharacterized protein n=1 Tax=Marinomonas piezotolerans TaxID=2213058 RepID=A0A370U7G1_9GAMM|nr:hypothetical protein [Marinomonas piezotolerans]RDL43704.1 hypothetical protein DN730_13235 [Marinomonas piezotolerans]